MILPTQNEFYIAKVYKRKKNEYAWEETPYITFKCRPANQMENKSYRIYKGVQGSQESVYLYATNLPGDISTDDKIEFLGQIKMVKSIGYYFDDSIIVNASLYSPEYIFKNSPKGLNLQ